MLSSLYIENIAVIEKTNIDFQRGLNVLTGETGAGKSIVIDALSAVLGHRSSKELVRSGAEKAFVSARFEDLSPLSKKKLSSLGFEAEDDAVILTRELSKAGKNTCRVNSRPATVSSLREIGEYLVNIHGQNDNLELMNPALHIVYIDALAHLGETLSRYRAAFSAMKNAKEAYDSASFDENERLQKIDLLSFQINELEDAAIEPGELSSLDNEKTMLLNRERILKELMKSRHALQGESDESDGVLRLLDDAQSALINASRYLEKLEGLCDRLSSALYELEDISSEIENAADELDMNPGRLEEIEQRLDLLYRLRKKYGDSEEEMLAFLENATREKDRLEHLARDRQNLKEEYEAKKAEAEYLAEQLSQLRKEEAKRFVEAVEKEMAFLLMPHVKLEVEISEVELNSRGKDRLEFLISTNPGEAPKPVSKIASGGELARMMLAIKTVISKEDFVSTLIFDEVDTGISGSAAGRVGKKLKQLSADSQILCVTHQAQIAAFADAHFLIEKSVENGRTYTRVGELDDRGRIEEIARIVGGENVTDSARAHAKQLLSESD